MVETLPNELVELIIENLYPDKTTLFNCALVGRVWVRSSQRGIFRQIVLRLPRQRQAIDEYKKFTGQLLKSFDAKPFLATYVHSLEIRWNTPSRHGDSTHSATNTIIHRLSNVKELSFSTIHWTLLPSSLQASLADLFKAPSLTRICFTNSYMSSCAQLASILSQAKHLKVLNVDISFSIYSGGAAVLESEDEKAKHVPRSIQLNELTLGGDPRFITWFQRDWCPIEVRNLQMLSLVVFNTSESLGLVKLAGRNLKELRLMRMGSSNLNSYLKYTPNLNILHLDLPSGQTQSNNVAIIQSIFQPLLNQDGTRFPLQHLTICLHLDQLEHENRLGTSDPLDPWAVIDTLFQKTEFGLLETVLFDLDDLRMSGSAEGLFHSKLPFLEKSGKLMVNIWTVNGRIV